MWRWWPRRGHARRGMRECMALHPWQSLVLGSAAVGAGGRVVGCGDQLPMLSWRHPYIVRWHVCSEWGVQRAAEACGMLLHVPALAPIRVLLHARAGMKCPHACSGRLGTLHYTACPAAIPASASTASACMRPAWRLQATHHARCACMCFQYIDAPAARPHPTPSCHPPPHHPSPPHPTPLTPTPPHPRVPSSIRPTHRA